MAVRGTIAKQNVQEKIKQAFGSDYVGEYDKKIIVFADDGGERVQIALSMTCPKTMMGIAENTMSYNQGIDFTNDNVIIPPSQSTEISEEEKENVRKLMERIGL